MTQQIGILIKEQSLNVPLTGLLSLLAPKVEGIAGTLLQAGPASPSLPAAFGAALQGGIYVGPIWGDGKLVHLIAAPETLDDAKWDDAKTAASEYRGTGHSDWFLPTRDHLEIARIYAQEKFEKVYHWSATPYGSRRAWAVAFESGSVFISTRGGEFRVRPFRRFIA